MKDRDKNLKYVLYARKSSEGEDRQVSSIEDQVKRMSKISREQNLNIVKNNREAKSAKNPGSRPLFKEMLEYIENKKANAIITWQINRLSRNPIDSSKIQWMLQKGKIQEIQTIEKKYLPEDNVLLLSIESGMANQYILDLSKNVKRGLESRRQKGIFPHLAPVGYLNDKATHTIVKDPQRFDMIRKMWD